MPKGTVFFPDDPIPCFTAPLLEAQLIETRLINILHFQTVIASKAARMVLTAPGKRLVDFGLRRAHGAEAGLLAARASNIAGFAGTATKLEFLMQRNAPCVSENKFSDQAWPSRSRGVTGNPNEGSHHESQDDVDIGGQRHRGLYCV